MASGLADVGATAERRAETRRGMLETADDPEQLARYRDRLAERDPQYGEMPLDDLAASLRDMVARTMSEPDAEEAATRWAALERWQHDVDERLSDAALDAWNQKRILRRSP